MLRVEKVGAHAASWENLRDEAGRNRASIDSSEKGIIGLPTDSFIGQGRTYNFL